MFLKGEKMFSEATIQFTEKCNIACPYCFSSIKRDKMLSAENFARFMKFCEKETLDVIHVTGGEPALNPNFGRYITNLAEISSLVVYSNFTVAGMLNDISAKNPSEVVFLVNTNSRNFYPELEKEFNKNLEQAHSKGFRIALSHTFYAGTEFLDKEFSVLIEMMRAYKLRNLRISQALTFSDDKQFMTKEDIKKLYHYVAEKIADWKKEGFSVYFDCPVPPCYIALSDFKKLREYRAVSVRCLPKAFIMWNLDVTHCYSTMNGSTSRNLSSFNSLAEVKKYSESLLKNIHEKSNRSGCFHCSYGKDDIPCGCPSYCV